MSLVRGMVLLHTALSLLIFSSSSPAPSFKSIGGLDCNGHSQIQRPLRPQDTCADFYNAYGGRGYDNGPYIGHDEPSIGFISAAPHWDNNVQWEFTLARERPLPATQSFENVIAFCSPWRSATQIQVLSAGRASRIATRTIPTLPGERSSKCSSTLPAIPLSSLRFSCDLTHWCAVAAHQQSRKYGHRKLNPNCTETTNFAFIQTDGIPTGPPGPNTMTDASATPSSRTLLMNQGDRLRVTIQDVTGDDLGGVLTMIEDLSTGQSGSW